MEFWDSIYEITVQNSSISQLLLILTRLYLKIRPHLRVVFIVLARGGKFPKANLMETSSMEISMKISGNFHGYNQDYGNFPPNFWRGIIFSDFQKSI